MALKWCIIHKVIIHYRSVMLKTLVVQSFVMSVVWLHDNCWTWTSGLFIQIIYYTSKLSTFEYTEKQSEFLTTSLGTWNGYTAIKWLEHCAANLQLGVQTCPIPLFVGCFTKHIFRLLCHVLRYACFRAASQWMLMQIDGTEVWSCISCSIL